MLLNGDVCVVVEVRSEEFEVKVFMFSSRERERAEKKNQSMLCVIVFSAWIRASPSNLYGFTGRCVMWNDFNTLMCWKEKGRSEENVGSRCVRSQRGSGPS